MQPTVQDLVSIQCSTCGAKIQLGDEHCRSCGRKVTRDEIGALRRRWEASDPEAARRGDAVAYGRSALLIVAGLAFVEAVVYGFIGESIPALASCMVVSGSMVALFFWGRRRPLAAMFGGLAVYVLLQVLAAIASVMTLAQGLLMKIVVLMTLSAGIGAELHHRKLTKDLVRRRAANPAP